LQNLIFAYQSNQPNGYFKIVFIAENVDVDVDEPAVTVRWSIFACGDEFALSGTHGIHGSDLCGVPSIALRVYLNQYAPFVLCHPLH
jgi:hypothetical protein